MWKVCHQTWTRQRRGGHRPASAGGSAPPSSSSSSGPGAGAAGAAGAQSLARPAASLGVASTVLAASKRSSGCELSTAPGDGPTTAVARRLSTEDVQTWLELGEHRHSPGLRAACRTGVHKSRRQHIMEGATDVRVTFVTSRRPGVPFRWESRSSSATGAGPRLTGSRAPGTATPGFDGRQRTGSIGWNCPSGPGPSSPRLRGVSMRYAGATWRTELWPDGPPGRATGPSWDLRHRRRSLSRMRRLWVGFNFTSSSWGGGRGRGLTPSGRSGAQPQAQRPA